MDMAARREAAPVPEFPLLAGDAEGPAEAAPSAEPISDVIFSEPSSPPTLDSVFPESESTPPGEP